MTGQTPIILVAISAVFLLLAVTACTPGELQSLEGILQNVDMVSGNVTVKLKDGSTKNFNFNDVKVETIRQALGNASLDIGDQIVVRASKKGEVKGIEVQSAEIEGTIKNLSTGNITIATQKKGDISINITPETVIKIEDKGTAAISDLIVGQKVEAKYDVKSMKALRITVNINEEDDKDAENDEHKAGTTDNSTGAKGKGLGNNTGGITDNKTGTKGTNTNNNAGIKGNRGHSSENNSNHEDD
jgi:hypothetical protein